MNFKGQGYLLNLVQGHSDSTFSNFFFLKPAWPIEAKFYVEPPWDGGMIDCLNGPDRMINMAAMPIYGSNLKNLFLWNQKADDLESWYAALGTRILPNLFKWWPLVDLDLFYGNVQFGPLCFSIGKR